MEVVVRGITAGAPSSRIDASQQLIALKSHVDDLDESLDDAKLEQIIVHPEYDRVTSVCCLPDSRDHAGVKGCRNNSANELAMPMEIPAAYHGQHGLGQPPGARWRQFLWDT
ncbi:hypothetical protein BIW11_05086 [Tropilaelaps mercedesae]|uniref:Uncharacterized protein n=1 Tax=Tropilaelaps mercedesae TaxID=418985 RepID=A0A1V9Y3U0_9ACAR|nr:hypothetical protein BIW11_05086 [Tropilaelaps mercedesae]